MGFVTGFSEAFVSGGLWMWFILGLQITTFAIIIERVRALYLKRKPIQREIVARFENHIKTGDISKAFEEARETPTFNPIGRTVAAGAQAAMNMGGKEEIQGKMDEVLLEENQGFERRIGFLAMIANVATLAGLLGTITGMIKSFAAVSSANPMEKATLLSTGISEAMNTTAYGLVVAIPALIIYGVLTNRATELSEDLNQAALKAFNWLSFSYNPLAEKPSVNQTQAPTMDA